MSEDEAIKIALKRDGKPEEFDWELAEAALLLAKKLQESRKLAAAILECVSVLNEDLSGR